MASSRGLEITVRRVWREKINHKLQPHECLQRFGACSVQFHAAVYGEPVFIVREGKALEAANPRIRPLVPEALGGFGREINPAGICSANQISATRKSGALLQANGGIVFEFFPVWENQQAKRAAPPMVILQKTIEPVFQRAHLIVNRCYAPGI